jgi:hypothetical protein
MKWLILAIAIAAPLVFRAAYQPIDATWTVQTFGCGCPPLDGSFRFNANHFNAIVWLTLLATCTFPWVVAAVRRDIPLAAAMVGMIAVIYLCLHGYGSGIWL